MTNKHIFWIIIIALNLIVISVGVYVNVEIQEIREDNRKFVECVDATICSLKEFRKDPNNTGRADIVFNDILSHSPEKYKKQLIEAYK